MDGRQPIAFLSYVRSDDDHDDGRITAFRKRLEGEVRMQTGQDFAIFQDRNDIAWGQNWEERIRESLSDVTFLIPIITPSFFRSPACRTEFSTFSLKERTLGLNRLILPLYYVICDQLGPNYEKGTDEIADLLKERNWTDWRQFRFKPFSDESVSAALAEMASQIKASIEELNSISVLSEIKYPESQRTDTISDLSDTPSEGLATPPEQAAVSVESPMADAELFEIPELNPAKRAGPVDEEKIRSNPYYVYTKQFDEVVIASSLAEKAEIGGLNKYISSFTRALDKLHGPSLNSFLSQFFPKSEHPLLSVSILIDNSGSMRGTKIVHTAAWCVLISEWLDRLRIPVEILGFTTRAWKGGSSRELWLASGQPKSPGRLNDLRYLVYKSFSTSVADSVPNLSVMVKEGILKENVDGEALLWAASRLQEQPTKNKILCVISDGAPVDDSTLSVNPGNFLEKHLLSVIDSLSSEFTLYAFGVEHDVSRYYPNAVALKEASELGPRFFEALVNDPGFSETFQTSHPKKRHRFSQPR